MTHLQGRVNGMEHWYTAYRVGSWKILPVGASMVSHQMRHELGGILKARFSRVTVIEFDPRMLASLCSKVKAACRPLDPMECPVGANQHFILKLVPINSNPVEVKDWRLKIPSPLSSYDPEQTNVNGLEREILCEGLGRYIQAILHHSRDDVIGNAALVQITFEDTRKKPNHRPDDPAQRSMSFAPASFTCSFRGETNSDSHLGEHEITLAPQSNRLWPDVEAHVHALLHGLFAPRCDAHPFA